MTLEIPSFVMDTLMLPLSLNDNEGIFEKFLANEPYALEEWMRLEKMGLRGFVAGGFPAYLFGDTKTYNDIDIFTDNIDLYFKVFNSSDKYINPYDNFYEFSLGNNRIVNKNRNSAIYHILNHVDLKIQIIFIHNTSIWKGVSFYYEILKRFDLQICRRGFYMFKDKLKCLYVNIGGDFILTGSRKRKYDGRRLTYGSPVTLFEMCQHKLLSLDKDYDVGGCREKLIMAYNE